MKLARNLGLGAAMFAFACTAVQAERTKDVRVAPLPVPAAETQGQYLAVAQKMQAMGDYAGALTFFQRVLDTEPNNAEAVYGTADAMTILGQALDSTKYYGQFQQLRPNDPRGPIGMARAFNRANRPADALAALDANRKITGSSMQAFQERGIALDLSGRNKEAQTVYADALRAAPKNLDILRRMALSFALTEDYPTALNLLQTVANEPGGAQTIRQSVALVYALSGQAEAAVKIAATTESEATAKQRLAFFRSLPNLTLQQRARAVHLNEISPEYVNQQLANMASALVIPQNGGAPAEDRNVDETVASPPRPAKPLAAPKPQMVAMPQPDILTAPDVSLGDQTISATPPIGTATPVHAAPLPPGDRFWVQLAASTNRAKLLQEWNRSAAKANGGLNSYAPYVVADMIDYKPILRLVVGGFFDGSTAQAMVGRLKSLGVVSILKRNALPADPLFP
jgi:Flp pilus assembly protein TadD